jgi:hypothetical protein
VYDVGVAPEAISDDACRRSDEAVRRLREESGRRIARRRTPGMSHCMLGTMLSMLLFVALNSRLIYWASAHSEESARRPAPAPSVNLDLPRAEDVKVTGFVPWHHGRGRGLEAPRCVVEYGLLSGERSLSCAHDGRTRASTPTCAGSHNGH